MEQKVQYIFSEEDKKLLSEPLPESPCKSKCGGHDPSCCGCNEYSEYSKQIKVYEDAGILEFARTIETIKNNVKKVKSINESINKDLDSLPSEVIEIVFGKPEPTTYLDLMNAINYIRTMELIIDGALRNEDPERVEEKKTQQKFDNVLDFAKYLEMIVKSATDYLGKYYKSEEKKND